MRNAFVNTLVGLAERDERVTLLTGDLGFAALEPFMDRFPDRFHNVGVAEQNMVGLATGLASSGMVPFVYSIATFASMRPYEFIRNGPILHELPVRVVGVGGGVDYGHNGPTHYALEDLAIMRCQPGIAVFAPADATQTEAAVRATVDLPGPVYLRLQRGGPQVPGLNGRFQPGRVATIGDGEDATIVTCGGITLEAVAAAEILAGQGIKATVAVMASLAPPPLADLEHLLSRSSVVISVEEHFPNGGVGSLVAELIAERGIGIRLTRIAMPRMPLGDSGSSDYMHARHGFTAPQIAGTVHDAVAAQQGRGQAP